MLTIQPEGKYPERDECFDRRPGYRPGRSRAGLARWTLSAGAGETEDGCTSPGPRFGAFVTFARDAVCNRGSGVSGVPFIPATAAPDTLDGYVFMK